MKEIKYKEIRDLIKEHVTGLEACEEEIYDYQILTTNLVLSHPPDKEKFDLLQTFFDQLPDTPPPGTPICPSNEWTIYKYRKERGGGGIYLSYLALRVGQQMRERGESMKWLIMESE